MLSKAQRRRCVYLAARSIFIGERSLIRDQREIKRIISCHPDAFREPLQSSSASQVEGTIFSLLAKGVFESELKAKLEFPDLFSPSPSRSLQRDQSERQAAQEESETLESISHTVQPLPLDDPVEQVNLEDECLVRQNAATDEELTLSLHPIRFDMQSQYYLLSLTQALLEGCCFDFAKRHFPEDLRQKNWHCRHAVELQRWSVFLPARFQHLPPDSTNFQSALSLRDALNNTHRIRHAAVHRVSTAANSVVCMLQEADKVLKGLNDLERSSQVEEILRLVTRQIEELDLHKNFFERELDEAAESFKQKRQLLDFQEKEFRQCVMAKDEHKTLEMGSNLRAKVAAVLVAVTKSKSPGDLPDVSSSTTVSAWNEDDLETMSMAAGF